MKNWLKNNYKWFSTTLIAISGLILSISLAVENHQYKRLSAKPILNISTYQNEEGVGFKLLSGGLGPAIYKWTEVQVDGVPQKNWESVDSLLKISAIGDKIWGYFSPGASIQPGNSPKFYWKKPGPNAEKLKNEHKRITIRLCYCSMYDECWLTIYKNGKSLSNPTCGKEPKTLFPSKSIKLLTLTPIPIRTSFLNLGHYLSLISLISIMFGTILIAFSVFPSGKRGTSPAYQVKKGKEIPIGMISTKLFRFGILFLIIGYIIQIYTLPV